MKIRVLSQYWPGLACIAVSVALASPASAHDTTRIEPAPIYGATVETQAGVRIIRFLPPSRQIIVDPKVTTPLTIKINRDCKKASCSK